MFLDSLTWAVYGFLVDWCSSSYLLVSSSIVADICPPSALELVQNATTAPQTAGHAFSRYRRMPESSCYAGGSLWRSVKSPIASLRRILAVVVPALLTTVWTFRSDWPLPFKSAENKGRAECLWELRTGWLLICSNSFSLWLSADCTTMAAEERGHRRVQEPRRGRRRRLTHSGTRSENAFSGTLPPIDETRGLWKLFES